MDWKKEKPLIETEGLIKGLYSTSNTPSCFIQAFPHEKMNNVMSDGSADLIESAPRRSPHIESFVQVGIPIRGIVEGLLSQRNRSGDLLDFRARRTVNKPTGEERL